MGLLDLVEQNDAVRLAAHSLGKLAAFVITHIPRRCADQALHGEFLHVLRHIDANHGLLIIEQAFCQRFCKFSLTNAGRSEEQEAADRLLGISEPCTAAADRARYRRNGLVLSNHTLVQTILKIDELLHFALHHLRDRDARPRRNHLGDLVFSDLLFQDGAICLARFERCSRCFQLLLQFRNAPETKLGSSCQIAFTRCALFFELRRFDIGLQVLDRNDGVLLVLPFSLALVERFLSCRDILAQLFETLLTRLVRFLHERLLFDLHLRELALGQIDLFRHRIDLDAQT